MVEATTGASDRAGVRQLKDGLSRYLAVVKAGGEVVITDHGRPVARLVPVDESLAWLEALIRRGEVRPPDDAERTDPEPVKARGSVSDIVIEQRGW